MFVLILMSIFNINIRSVAALRFKPPLLPRFLPEGRVQISLNLFWASILFLIQYSPPPNMGSIQYPRPDEGDQTTGKLMIVVNRLSMCVLAASVIERT